MYGCLIRRRPHGRMLVRIQVNDCDIVIPLHPFILVTYCWVEACSPRNYQHFSHFHAIPSSPSTGDGPAGRQAAAMTFLSGYLFIYGGYDPVSNVTFSDLWAFHTIFRTWQLLVSTTGQDNGMYLSCL